MRSILYGMEGVIAAKNVCETVPVLWFSNDDGFGVQSISGGVCVILVIKHRKYYYNKAEEIK